MCDYPLAFLWESTANNANFKEMVAGADMMQPNLSIVPRHVTDPLG